MKIGPGLKQNSKLFLKIEFENHKMIWDFGGKKIKQKRQRWLKTYAQVCKY